MRKLGTIRFDVPLPGPMAAFGAALLLILLMEGLLWIHTGEAPELSRSRLVFYGMLALLGCGLGEVFSTDRRPSRWRIIEIKISIAITSIVLISVLRLALSFEYSSIINVIITVLLVVLFALMALIFSIGALALATQLVRLAFARCQRLAWFFPLR